MKAMLIARKGRRATNRCAME
uniref:Uncharacterized protein n=1 Tax=Arundo donax TaxID=35708 RepID=A0A0A9EKC5_ARUDO